jgi:hypothetical protein
MLSTQGDKRNIAVGMNALGANTTGGNNVQQLVCSALFANTTGSQNTAVGSEH